MNNRDKVDIVVPVYNEARVVKIFHDNLINILNSLSYNWRVIYIDDGSTDTTLSELISLANADQRVMVVQLSRNFGHQAALSAGLSLADGDYVISMDGDGQHPPEVIPEMLALAEQGYDIVLTHRLEQKDQGYLKKWTSNLFYWLINFIGSTRLEPNSADFRLMNAKTILALGNIPEYHRFIRGIVSWIGFQTVVLPFKPKERIAGVSKYSLKKMLRLASDAMFSFSLVPLYLVLLLGCAFLFFALLEMIYVLSFWITGNINSLIPGWSSLMFVLLFTGGAVIITLGIIGIYVGYILQEVKRRPIYIIRQIYPESRSEDQKV